MLPLLLLGLFAATRHTHGQGGGPPPPPPPQALNPPPVPAGNPITTAKVNLGKTLFWDEQLSSTRTVSCGTCHQPSKGGVDPRTLIGDPRSTHPGPDGLFGNADDVTGSIGLPLSNADGTYSLDPNFGFNEQVTGRYPPSMINAAYFPSLFWDGRATGQFNDPISGATILANGAALESQASGPPTGSSEMAHQGRDWNDVASRVNSSTPLALARDIPADLETWIGGRDYPALFNEAYGSSTVSPAHIVMAIATYERTLVTTNTTWDVAARGGTPLSAAAQRGLNFFNGPGRCVTCHSGALFSDAQFHNIGLRPQNAAEDQGRFVVTGNNNDRQDFKTPSLRNTNLHGQFMHNGRFANIDEVLDFYARGGDFPRPPPPGAPPLPPGTITNPENELRPFRLDPGPRADLHALLATITEPSVGAETGLFTRPSLYLDSPRMPAIVSTPLNGSGGRAPGIVAIEPPMAGNPNCTIGLTNALGGASATLIIDDVEPPASTTIPPANTVRFSSTITLGGSGNGNGFGSVPYAIPVEAGLIGNDLHARWYITDPGAAGGVAVSPVARLTVFPSPEPIATADTVMRSSGSTARISSASLFTNDVAGARGGALTVASVTQPTSGQATVSMSGSNLFYVPDAGFTGSDQFSYSVTDASGYTSTATIQVGVTTPPSDPNSGLRLSSQVMGGGQIMLNFKGIPGFTYRIQETDSMTPPITWQESGSATADALGNYNLQLTPKTSPAFFRAVYP